MPLGVKAGSRGQGSQGQPGSRGQTTNAFPVAGPSFGSGSVNDVSPCGICSSDSGTYATGCDKCSLWFHPRPKCTGISENSIKIMMEDRDVGSLLYVCTK